MSLLRGWSVSWSGAAYWKTSKIAWPPHRKKCSCSHHGARVDGQVLGHPVACRRGGTGRGEYMYSQPSTSTRNVRACSRSGTVKPMWSTPVRPGRVSAPRAPLVTTSWIQTALVRSVHCAHKALRLDPIWCQARAFTARRTGAVMTHAQPARTRGAVGRGRGDRGRLGRRRPGAADRDVQPARPDPHLRGVRPRAGRRGPGARPGALEHRPGGRRGRLGAAR